LEPVLDKVGALERLEGDKELWDEICGIWMDDHGAMLSAVRDAFDAASDEALRRAAHALKGASANIGAVRVASKAREIELAAGGGDRDLLGRLLLELLDEAERVRVELRG
jgi:two-component system sensor histidine kinase/response regulator